MATTVDQIDTDDPAAELAVDRAPLVAADIRPSSDGHYDEVALAQAIADRGWTYTFDEAPGVWTALVRAFVPPSETRVAGATRPHRDLALAAALIAMLTWPEPTKATSALGGA